MNDFVITCSSTCDLTKEYLKNNNNPFVSYSFLLGDKIYKDEFYDNISMDSFCEQIKTKTIKTSQPEPLQYEEMWETILQEGKDVLHIELSSGISGAYTSSVMIKNMLQEKYPDRKIEVIDSLCCSTGYGFLLKIANEKKQEGYDLEKLKNYIEDIKLKIYHIFIPNIEQLVKGGRIPAPIGIVAKAINIIPILIVDKNGKLETLSKTRGTNKAINTILEYIENNIENKNNYNERFLLEKMKANEILDNVLNTLKNIYKKATFDKNDEYNVGSVIGAHVGEGTFGIFFIGSNDRY